MYKRLYVSKLEKKSELNLIYALENEQGISTNTCKSLVLHILQAAQTLSKI